MLIRLDLLPVPQYYHHFTVFRNSAPFNDDTKVDYHSRPLPGTLVPW